MKSRRSITDRASAIPALAEAFREKGFEGASIAEISQATGLGKGSLYNFFPRGKEEMMDAVLADIDQWFETAVFEPLETMAPNLAIEEMMDRVNAYFESGGRVCLVGWIGLGLSRESFADRVKGYFGRWISSLEGCLQRGGVQPTQAKTLAEDTVAGIQGAIILTRALGDKLLFKRALRRLGSTMTFRLAQGKPFNGSA